jgi:hypothetical protein
MKFPSWTMKLAVAAAIPVAVGMTGAFSAPSPSSALEPGASTDRTYEPGEFGVDLAAVTGPRGSAVDKAKADCEHATWPNIPAKCLTGTDSGESGPVRILQR